MQGLACISVFLLSFAPVKVISFFTKNRNMKQFILFFALCIFSASVAFAGTAQYKIDDAQIDQLISSSEEVNAAGVDFAVTAPVFGTDANATKVAGEKNAVVAFILAWFLGYLGIHRFYLGTKALTFLPPVVVVLLLLLTGLCCLLA